MHESIYFKRCGIRVRISFEIFTTHLININSSVYNLIVLLWLLLFQLSYSIKEHNCFFILILNPVTPTSFSQVSPNPQNNNI